MKIYAVIGTSQQTLVADNAIYNPQDTEILMQSERTSDKHIAGLDGVWYLQELTLNELKIRKWEEIKSARDTAEQSGFEYIGKIFDSNQISVMRINLECINAQAAITSSTDFEIEWTTKDNSTILLTAQQMLGCAVALAKHSNQCHTRGRELRKMIELAKTQEELNNIVW